MSDDDWAEVKTKKKFKPMTQSKNGGGGIQYGGMTAKGTLIAGPVQQVRYGGATFETEKKVVNHASVVADHDFGVERGNEESKFEKVSHVCAAAVSAARTAAKLSQADLAKRVNDKTAAIVELENGTARYNADLVNRIAKTLQVQIPRGRKSNNNKKK